MSFDANPSQDSDNIAFAAGENMAFALIRTRIALRHASDGLMDALSDAFDRSAPGDAYRYSPAANVMALGPERDTWSDGLAIAIGPGHPSDWAERMSEALAMTDGWAIFNGAGEYAEHPAPGPLSVFMERASQSRGCCKIFLLWEGEGTQRVTAAIEAIKSRFREPIFPVFHWRDGVALLLATEDPALAIWRRIEKHLSAIKRWAIIDHQNQVMSDSGRGFDNAFEMTNLDEVSFED